MSEVRFCEQCGAGLEPEDRFCSGCGAEIVRGPVGTPVPGLPETPASKPKPASVPPARKKRSVLPLMLVLLAACAAGALYFWTQKGSDSHGILSTAEAFMPEAGLKYTYFANYTDGTSMTFDQLAVQVPNSNAVALITLIPESEAFVEYLVPMDGGLFMASDQDVGNLTLHLPSELTVGSQWESPGFRGEIQAAGELCDVGFQKFDDCLRLKLDYYEAQVQYIAWYAPGVGVVRMVYEGTDTTAAQLQGIAPVPEAEQEAALERYAVNRSSFQ